MRYSPRSDPFHGGPRRLHGEDRAALGTFAAHRCASDCQELRFSCLLKGRGGPAIHNQLIGARAAQQE